MNIKTPPKKPTNNPFTRVMEFCLLDYGRSSIKLTELEAVVFAVIRKETGASFFKNGVWIIKNDKKEGTFTKDDISITRDEWDGTANISVKVRFLKTEAFFKKETETYLDAQAKYDKWYSDNKEMIQKELERREKQKALQITREKERLQKEIDRLNNKLNAIR